MGLKFVGNIKTQLKFLEIKSGVGSRILWFLYGPIFIYFSHSGVLHFGKYYFGGGYLGKVNFDNYYSEKYYFVTFISYTIIRIFYWMICQQQVTTLRDGIMASLVWLVIIRFLYAVFDSITSLIFLFY
jgi:hypothetical protein